MKLSEAQQTALSLAPFILTGPWHSHWDGVRFRPTRYGIQTVEQDPMRWMIEQHWPAVTRRLVRKRRLVLDRGVYRTAPEVKP